MNESTPGGGSGLPVAVTGDLATGTAGRIAVFEMEIPIRWADMDAQRHVNNVMYFRYMEQARISWIDAMDVRSHGGEQGPVVINAYCSFLQQMRFPATILARLSVAQFGRSSVMTFVDMSLTDEPDNLYATGGAKLVWVNYEKAKSTPLPDHVRERMSRPVSLLGNN